MQAYIDEIIISEEKLQARISEMASEITRDYRSLHPVLIGVLRGAFIFIADLARQMPIPLVIDFISVSSYGDSTQSSGVVQLTKDLSVDISNRHVLLVEDIVDTGLTLSYLLDLLLTRKPASLKVCVLLDKHECRKKEVKLDYVGFPIPDVFVMGYGLDCQDFHRNLRFISTPTPEAFIKF